MSQINNFGKYFIIKNEFEAIPEEDETLEAGSFIEEHRNKRTVSEAIKVQSLVDEASGERYLEPSDLDELMKMTDANKLSSDN